MPALKDTLSKGLEGYEPVSVSKPPDLPNNFVPGKGAGNFSPNRSIRTPLPPFNIGPDTLRQFDESQGTGPKRRVMPLPILSQIGGGVTISNTTVSTSSGSSSSSATSLTAKTVAYTSPLLAAGASNSQVLTLSKSYQLIAMVSNFPCEVRLYGSLSAQAADIGRPQDSPLPAELFNNLITDVVLDTAPFVWSWQNRVGVNTDSPQDAQAFITAYNIGSAPVQLSISIVYLPLES